MDETSPSQKLSSSLPTRRANASSVVLSPKAAGFQLAAKWRSRSSRVGAGSPRARRSRRSRVKASNAEWAVEPKVRGAAGRSGSGIR